jgi:hypothetical protein
MQGDRSIVEKEMGSREAYGRLIGALFLAGISRLRSGLPAGEFHRQRA